MKRTIKIKNFFLYIFTFWYSTEIIFNSTLINKMGSSFDKLNNIITWIVFGLLMFQILFFQLYTRRELLIIAGVTLPIVVATVLSGQRTILSAWMFIVAAKNVELEKVIRRAQRIGMIMIPIIVTLCIFGLIENATLMRGDVRRSSLGFLHPNQLGLRVFQLIVCSCYVYRNALKKQNFLYIIFSIIFLIWIPNSKTAYIIMTIFLLMLFLYQYIKNKKPQHMGLYEKGIYYGCWILNIFSIMFSYIDVGKNPILTKVDDWMSSRLSFCHKVWSLYGVTLFGQRIYVTEDERKIAGIGSRLWLDNAYVSMLLRYGILTFAIFSAGYLCLIKLALAQKEHMLAIILFLYALYGVMENGLYMITHNIFLITFAALLFRKPIQSERQLE